MVAASSHDYFHKSRPKGRDGCQAEACADRLLRGDVEAATQFIADTEAKHVALEAEAAAFTGKANQQARQKLRKEASALMTTPEYINACSVVKCQPLMHGPDFSHLVGCRVLLKGCPCDITGVEVIGKGKYIRVTGSDICTARTVREVQLI